MTIYDYDYQYPLKMSKKLSNKIQKLADEERRSFNQTVLLILEKHLEGEE